ncbi:MAG: hypothetical protein OXF02_07200 [Simkaniaceae bacterium]|nr:hypothetical protein [Simkaniaceae bacterium]
MAKVVVTVAGPKGSDKSTMMSEMLLPRSGSDEWLNADDMAKGLAPVHPERVALTAGNG